MRRFLEKYGIGLSFGLAAVFAIGIATGAPEAGRVLVRIFGYGPAGTATEIGVSADRELKIASRAFTAPGDPVVLTLPTDGGYACAGPADAGCGATIAIASGDTVRVSCNEATGDAYYLLGANTAAPTVATGNILPDRAVERMLLTGTQTAIGFSTAATTGTPKCRVAIVGEVP